MAQWTPSPPGRAFCMLPPRQCLPSQGRSIVESTPFSAWENFYVIIGSSAAALTGLQFVVVVLGAEARSLGPEVGAFGTPTVVHFCAVLLMSAILSVPWRTVSHAGLALSAGGVAGIVYIVVVIRRARALDPLCRKSALLPEKQTRSVHNSREASLHDEAPRFPRARHRGSRGVRAEPRRHQPDRVARQAARGAARRRRSGRAARRLHA